MEVFEDSFPMRTNSFRWLSNCDPHLYFLLDMGFVSQFENPLENLFVLIGKIILKYFPRNDRKIGHLCP